MHPSTVLLIVVAAASIAGVQGRHPADGTPAVRFWEEALPGTPMPEAIAELVQKGIDHSPLADNSSAPYLLPRECLEYSYKVIVCPWATAATSLFFHEAQVRVGSTMTASIPARAVPAILSRDLAKQAPFGNLADVLTTFHIAPGSGQAARVGDTLSRCQAPPLAGEQKACATSLEGVVQAAMRMLGTDAPGRRVWVAASALPPAGLPLQQYDVVALTPLDGDHHVACHDEPFPYAVFQCHMTGLSSTKAYVISLRGLHGGPAIAVAAICHLDTSNWNPAHPAFKILRTRPGGAPVCHFMPYANLLFGEKAANA